MNAAERFGLVIEERSQSAKIPGVVFLRGQTFQALPSPFLCRDTHHEGAKPTDEPAVKQEKLREEVLDMALAQAYPGAGADVTRRDGIHVAI